MIATENTMINMQENNMSDFVSPKKISGGTRLNIVIRNRKRSSIRRIALGCDTPTVDGIESLDNSIITNNYRLFNKDGVGLSPTGSQRLVYYD